MPYISNRIIKDNAISFDLNNKNNDIKISLANAIRRTIISEIDTYIIDHNNTIFYENTSMLNNEFLKHRLTLIPIISDIADINYDNLIISCKKKNDGEYMESVYVSDFVCKDSTTDVIIDNNIIFKYPSILFGKLKNDQYLSFESKLVKNNAMNGGSFYSPVSVCLYKFKFEEDERSYEKNSKGEPDVYMFNIESIGFYSPINIALKGIDLLITRLDFVKNEFLNKNSKKVMRVNTDNLNYYSFLIDKENDTIGNLLSTYITYDKNVMYCGYIIEHPLKNNIILKIQLKEDNTLENNIKNICDNIDILINIINNIKTELSN